MENEPTRWSISLAGSCELFTCFGGGLIGFSRFRLFGFSAFRLFGFSAFRLFDFSAFRSNHVRSTLIRYTHDICIQFFGISRDLNLNFWKYVAVSKVSKWKEVRQSWTNGLGFWKSPITSPSGPPWCKVTAAKKVGWEQTNALLRGEIDLQR